MNVSWLCDAPLPPFYFRATLPRLVTKCKRMIRPTFCFKRVWSNLSSKFKRVLCCHAVTKPQNASVWYGPPSVSSVCDQTCRQNSSACFAAMLWQNHKGGWYGPPTATSSITLPLYAVTSPQRWMIRPTYIANECIMTMWRFAPSRLFISEPPPAACDKMQVYDTAHLL